LGRRYRVKRTPGHYVQRDRRGRFRDWTSIPRGIRRDAAKKAPERRKESGYGHRQDYKRRRKR
jgi:hypothetical protein